MIVFHSVVDTLDNRIAEVGVFHFGFYLALAIIFCNVALWIYRTGKYFYDFMWGDSWKKYRDMTPDGLDGIKIDSWEDRKKR